MAAFTHDADGAEFVIGRANYVTYDGLGTDWAYQEIPGAVRGDEGEGAPLALGLRGCAPQPATALNFGGGNGTAWNQTFQDNAGDVGKYFFLALDRLDRVHIAYYDASG